LTWQAEAEGQDTFCKQSKNGGGRCIQIESCNGDWSEVDDLDVCNYAGGEVCCHGGFKESGSTNQTTVQPPTEAPPEPPIEAPTGPPPVAPPGPPTGPPPEPPTELCKTTNDCLESAMTAEGCMDGCNDWCTECEPTSRVNLRKIDISATKLP